MIRSHKIRLYPTQAQEAYFVRACGCARFAYNWGLEQWDRMCKEGGKPAWPELRRQFDAIKRENFPFVLEVTKCAVNQPFVNLGKAFAAFYAKRNKYPSFKKRGIRDSFYIESGSLRFNEMSIRIPKLGWVDMAEPLRFAGRVKSVTVSKTADYWFASVSVELANPTRKNHGEGVVGVDLGVASLATLSDGIKFKNPRAFAGVQKKIARLQRRLRKKVRRSNRYTQCKHKIARLYYRAACIRNYAIHQVTTYLTRNYSVVGIESLNVRGMLKNRKLARVISDAAFAMFRHQLEYKAEEAGVTIVAAPVFYASSKLCSVCGCKNDVLVLSMRNWVCPTCGVVHDRDVNAAENLKNMAAKLAVTARGEGRAIAPSMKRELACA